MGRRARHHRGLGVPGAGTARHTIALLDAFKGRHRGYFYVLAVYFTFLRIPSQLSAAALSCFAAP